MKTAAISLLECVVKNILNGLSNNLWDKFWEYIFEEVEEVEEKWDDGQTKKDMVMAKVMNKVCDEGRLGAIKKFIVELFLGIAIDTVVNIINEQIGDDWSEFIENKKDKLADKIKFID